MHRAIVFFLALFVLIGAFCSCARGGGRPPEDLRNRLLQLREAHQAGRLEVDDPARARQLLQQGRRALRWRQYGKARRILAELESIVHEEPAASVPAPPPVSGAVTAAVPDRGCPFGILDPYFNVPDRGQVIAFFADVGIRRARFGAPKSGGLAWNLERKPGEFDWSTVDSVIKHAGKHGLDILVTINPANKWDQEMRQPPPRKREDYFRLPVNLDRYETFVRKAVNRYKDHVSDWQVHNEPDGHFWSDTAENYGRLVEVTSRAIRQADPSARVVLAGISNPQFLRRALAQLRADGVTNAFDVADFHQFKLARVVPQRPDFGTYREAREKYERLRRVLADYGYGNVPIWITETSTYSGQPTVPRQWPRQSEREQAQDLVKRLLYPLAFGVGRVYWTTFVEWHNFNNKGVNGYFDNIGLIRNPRHGQGSFRKLSYYTFRRLVHGLDGVEWQKAEFVIDNRGDVFCVGFPAPEGRRYVVWWDGPFRGASQPEKTVSIPVQQTGQWRVVNLIPEGSTGKGLAPAEVRFPEHQGRSSGGELQVRLQADPLLITRASR